MIFGKLRVFEHSQFSTIMPIVTNGIQCLLLLELSVYSFNIWQVYNRHVEDVYEKLLA